MEKIITPTAPSPESTPDQEKKEETPDNQPRVPDHDKDVLQEDLDKAKKKAKENRKQSKGKVKGEKSGKVNKFKEATGKFLKKCYENAIGSWTLSMFGVYIYIFLLQIPQFNKFFCPIGQEWVPAMIKRKDPKEAKKIGDKIAIVEKPLIGCCCTFHLFLLIIIVFIIYVILNPGKFGWEFLKDFVKDILGRDYED
jgi:wobble nucleotide-excising tRNase